MTVDPQALHLFELYRERLRGFLSGKGLSTDDIDDALQEVYLRFALRIEDGAAIIKPGPYLFGIARNVVADHFRQRVPNAVDLDAESLLLAQDESWQSCALEQSADSAQLYRHMRNTLGTEDYAMCVLFHRDRLSYKEIGRLVDRSSHAVRKRLDKIKARLEQQMNPHGSAEKCPK